jgi:hypothetical protein
MTHSKQEVGQEELEQKTIVDIVDEDLENAYSIDIIKAVLINAIENMYSWKMLSWIAGIVFGVQLKIVRWFDDDGYGLAYSKTEDYIEKYLATMAIKNIRKSNE